MKLEDPEEFLRKCSSIAGEIGKGFVEKKLKIGEVAFVLSLLVIAYLKEVEHSPEQFFSSIMALKKEIDD